MILPSQDIHIVGNKMDARIAKKIERLTGKLEALQFKIKCQSRGSLADERVAELIGNAKRELLDAAKAAQ